LDIYLEDLAILMRSTEFVGPQVEKHCMESIKNISGWSINTIAPTQS